MQCPACNVTLMMTDRQGIEIDYCPQCRGVWLDRGELDKLIERGAREAAGAQPASPGQRPPHPGHRESHRDDDRYRYRKKKSLLGELFDF